MSSVTSPFANVIDPTMPGEKLLDLDGLTSDVVIVLSREDAARLAIALHEFDREGATLQTSLRVLRDRLDLILTSRQRPDMTSGELLAARRVRRKELWNMLLDEDRAIAANLAIQADLHPTPERAAQAAAEHSANGGDAGWQGNEPRKDWQ